jgi:YidC/Oxa1 family membrane protein insertase
MDLLYPVKWVIELLLVAFHSLFTFVGLNPDDGFTWVLAITGLVLVVRAALIPLFVKQIKSQRGMVLLQPELQKLQKKYKGKTDRDSREAFAKEQMALYKKTGSNPLSSCLPLLAQMPIFISLFFVLNEAQHNKQGIGMLTQELATSFANSKIFGAPLSASFFIPGTVQLNPILAVQIIAGAMIVLMTASQFITQKQIISKNQTPANLQNSQYMQTQKIMLWLFPIMFAISGVSFPLGVMTYWLVSNFWTMGQQFVVIKNMPTPGSLAHEQRQARLEAKGKLTKPEVVEVTEIETDTKGQRQQPVSKKRKKK